MSELCVHVSVGADGKVPVNLVFRELLFAFVHLWDLGEGCGHPVKKWIFILFLFNKMEIFEIWLGLCIMLQCDEIKWNR